MLSGKPPIAKINGMIAVEPCHIAYVATLVSFEHFDFMFIVMSALGTVCSQLAYILGCGRRRIQGRILLRSHSASIGGDRHCKPCETNLD